MAAAEDDPDREHVNQAEAPAPAADTPTGLQQAASGIAEAQAWKGQQVAKGWRKLVNALHRRKEGGGSFVSRLVSVVPVVSLADSARTRGSEGQLRLTATAATNG
jgi:hypothetical protein